jgi:hypothetical protein
MVDDWVAHVGIRKQIRSHYNQFHYNFFMFQEKDVSLPLKLSRLI